MRHTLSRQLLSIAILLIALCAQAQDFGLDINASLKKKITKGLNISAAFELRTQDMSSQMERIDAGIDISYKPIDYFRFGAGYDFIDKFYPKHHTNSGNIVDDYWSIRNRVNVYVTGILPIDNFEISLRERYQFTHRSQSSVKKWNGLGVAQDNKIIKAKNAHDFRSRILAKYKIKPEKLTPYLSMELYNDLASSFKIDKFKLTTGIGYSLKKHHEFELFYRYTAGIADPDDECHLLGLGYEFKF